MRQLKTFRWVQVAAVICVLLVAALCRADLTNDWGYTNSSQYTVSDSSQLSINENSPGYAELVLQATNTFLADYGQYSNGTPVSTKLSYGHDIGIAPIGTAGSYISRIFDKGAAVPEWKMLLVKSDEITKNIRDEIPSNAVGLVGLYHMNGDFKDATTNNNFATIISAGFTPDALFGSQAGSFSFNYAQTSKGFAVSNKLTVAFWFKATANVNGQSLRIPISSDRFEVRVGGSFNDQAAGSVPNCISFVGPGAYVSSLSGTITPEKDANVWHHCAVTFDADSQPNPTTIYKDGESLPIFLQFPFTNLPSYTTPSCAIGNRLNQNLWYWDGSLDEMAIYSRVLSQGEIRELYYKGFGTKVRVRTSSTATPGTDFCGPDGTTNSAFVTHGNALISTNQFVTTNRYAQYSLEMSSDINTNLADVESVALITSSGSELIDGTEAGFIQGDYTGVTNIPASYYVPTIRLAKSPNGGYSTNGSVAYISQIFDSGIPNASWQRITWIDVSELPTSIRGLVGLWHLNGAPSATFGSPQSTTSSNMTWSAFSKARGIGDANGSASFGVNGANSIIRFALNNPTLRTFEFWVNDDNPNDGLMSINSTFGDIALTVTNHFLSTALPAGAPPATIYLNGAQGSAYLKSGWNHVAYVFSTNMTVSGLVLGVGLGNAGTNYMDGLLDEMAIYSIALPPSIIKSHYVSQEDQAAGVAKAQMRAGNNSQSLGAFTGPDNTANTFYDNGGGITRSGQYIQYELFFPSDGNVTPLVAQVSLTNASGLIVDGLTRESLDAGDTVSDQSVLYGRDIRLDNRADLIGVNLDLSSEAGGALWHLDEDSWAAQGTIVLNSKSGNYDTSPNGNAATKRDSRFGVACGTFDGTNDYLTIPAVNLPNDFTISAWFKVTSANRCAIISTYDPGNPYYSLELNSDGSSNLQGAVSFSVSDGGVPNMAVSTRRGLNDGQWHNAVGVRQGQQLHVYIDGDQSGTTNMIAVFGSVGQGSGSIARRGSDSSYDLQGDIDEVAVWSRALSQAEIGRNACVGYRAVDVAEYDSTVFNAGRVSVWETLKWASDGPYSRPLQVVAGMAALWHMETNTASIASNDVAGAGSATISGATLDVGGGIFGNCLVFNGSANLSVSHNAVLEPSPITVEAWVKLDQVLSAVVLDKSSGANGYILGTDAGGVPYFRAGSTTCSGAISLRIGKWTHLAGSYDASGALRLYVDGQLAGQVGQAGLVLASGAALKIGNNQAGSAGVVGRIDEVAIHNKALKKAEILDHYRSGVVTLKFQARSSNTGSFSGIPFTGTGGLTNTYFIQSSLSNMVGHLSMGQYFQFRALMSTEDYKYSPRFAGLKLIAASYSSANPSVEPTLAQGYQFYGNLLGFSNSVSGANPPNFEVKYEISGDNGGSPRWFYLSGTNWTVDNANGGYVVANSAATINTNIINFYKQWYDKVGGLFRFRAFIHSTGEQQVKIDYTRLIASKGSLTLTEPQGLQNGLDAWIVGVTNIIKWTSAGNVGTNLSLEYSENAGTSWVFIAASGVPNTGSYPWLTPPVEGATYRVRIADINDISIHDESDANFELVQRYRLMTPNGGQVWYTGETNAIVWVAPPSSGNNIPLWVHSLGSTGWLGGANWQQIGFVPNTATRTNNTYQWVIPKNDAGIISEAARIGVSENELGDNFDGSDTNLTIAGIRIISPVLDDPLKRRDVTTIVWVSAGAQGDSVKLELSENGGTTWTTVTNAYPNSTGTNTFTWTVSSSNPTLNAILRATDNQQPRIWGESDHFKIADIDIKNPSKGTNWWINATNQIIWTQGGVGGSVNLDFSTNSGVSWISIDQNVATVDFPFTNSYDWIIPPNPSSLTRVRVQSFTDNSLQAISSNFNISGLLVESPNGPPEQWTMGSTGTITWGYASAGPFASAFISVSYDGGSTYLDVTNFAWGLSNRKYQLLPFQPTRFAKVKMQAVSPYTNIVDTSDTNFTVAGVKVISPTNGALYTLNQNIPTGIQFYAAGTYPVGGSSPTADVYYSSSGTGNWLKISTILYTESANFGLNSLDWTTDKVRDADPSTTARIQVLPVIAQSPYSGLSAPFTARGVHITRPATNTVTDVAGVNTIRWIKAGIDASATGRVDLSSDGGVVFSTNPVLTGVSVGGQTSVVWNVASDLYPSTNTVLRMTITSSIASNDVGYSCDTRPFTLRGTKITSPAQGTVWILGTSNNVAIQSVGLSDVGTLYYSSDGGTTFDLANPLRQNFALPEGSTNIGVILDPLRHAGTNIVLKLVSGIYSSLTPAFTVEGITITTPVGSDILALGDTNDIQWVSAGTVGNYTMDVITNGVVVSTVAGITATNQLWPVVSAAVGTGVIIRITDTGGYVGFSEPFEVVDHPLIRILVPTNGQYFRVSETATVTWARGGQMASNFAVYYTTNDFATWTLLTNSYTLVAGKFLMDWPLTDYSLLGNFKIFVTNTAETNIMATSQPFWMVPKFLVTAPGLGDTNFALRPTLVKWNTYGNISNVDLYYSTSPIRDPASWVKVNTWGTLTNVPGTLSAEESRYDWTPPNVTSLILWVRIQDTHFTNMYPITVNGPYDDCDGPFSIRRYSIQWHVYDQTSSNDLDKLSVVDSSGWSQSGMNSPIIHDYPYGTWDTVWYRDLFHNKVVFQWFADSNKVIDVPMEPSTIEPDYHVMGDFTFNTTNRQYSIDTWIERTGSVLPDPDATRVDIYDATGTLITSITNTTPDANGVFWLDWDVVATETALGYQFGSSDALFARVTVTYSGVDYNSGVTFSLTVSGATDRTDEVLAAIAAALKDVTNIVAGVSNQVASVATNVSAATAGITSLTATVTAGVSNILADVNSNRVDVANATNLISAFGTNTAARLTVISNEVIVAGQISSNAYSYMQTNLGVLAQSDLARILSRPESVTNGQVLTILYKTRTGYGAGVTVSVTNGAFNASLGTMTELYAGIYESAPITVTWPIGEYKLVCRDPGASDAITLAVVGQLNVSVDLSGLSNQLAGLSFDVTNVLTAVNSISNSLLPQFQIINNTINQLETNLTARIRGVSNAVMSVSGNITSNVIPPLATLGINLIDLAARVSNDVIPTLSVVSNSTTYSSNTLTTVNSNLLDMANRILTQVIPSLAAITNMTTYTTNSLATSVVPQVGTLAQMSNMLAGASNQMLSTVMPAMYGISNLAFYASNQITTAILPGLAGISTQVGVVSNRISEVSNAVQGVSNQMVAGNALMVAVSNRVGEVSNAVQGVSNQMVAASGLMGAVSNRISEVSNAVHGVSNQMVAGNALMVAVSNRVGEVSNAVQGVSNQMVAASGLMGAVSNRISEVSNAVQGVSNQMVAGTALMVAVSNRVGEVSNAVQGVSNQMVAASGLMGAVSNRISEVSNAVQGVSNQMVAGTALMVAVSNRVGEVSNAVQGVSNQLIDASAQVTGVSNQVVAVSGQATGISNQIIDASAQVTGVSNQVVGASAQITGMSNQIIAASAQIAGVSNQVEAARTALSTALTAIQTDVTSIKTAVADANLSGSVDLTALETSVGNIQTAIDGVNQAIGDIDLSGLNTIEAALAGLGEDLGTKLDSMLTSDSFSGQISDLESLLSGLSDSSSKKANAAKTEATAAADAADEIKTELKSGNLSAALAYLAELKDSLDKAKTNMDSIPTEIKVDNLYDQLQEMAQIVNETAAEGGFANLLNIGKKVEGSGEATAQELTIKELNSKVVEVQTVVGWLQNIARDEFKKPQVETDLLGGE